MDKIDTFSDTNTAIKDFFEQQQAQFVCGELDIDNDADWQAYVDGMYSLGLEDWVAIRVSRKSRNKTGKGNDISCGVKKGILQCKT